MTRHLHGIAPSMLLTIIATAVNLGALSVITALRLTAPDCITIETQQAAHPASTTGKPGAAAGWEGVVLDFAPSDRTGVVSDAKAIHPNSFFNKPSMIARIN